MSCASQPENPKSEAILREFSLSVQGGGVGKKGGANLNTVEKVEAYVDKQVRKELLEAMRQCDIGLLKNYTL